MGSNTARTELEIAVSLVEVILGKIKNYFSSEQSLLLLWNLESMRAPPRCMHGQLLTATARDREDINNM